MSGVVIEYFTNKHSDIVSISINVGVVDICLLQIFINMYCLATLLVVVGCGDNKLSKEKANLQSIEGIWDIAVPGVSDESYLVVGVEGEGTSYLLDSSGKGCLYSETRRFISLGEGRFLLVSPDSVDEPTVMKIIRQKNALKIVLEATGELIYWNEITNIDVAGLRVCDTTV